MPALHFAIIGDVHGSFARLSQVIEQARTSMGQLDAVLVVGDLEANRHARDASGVATGKGHRRWVGEFPKVVNGAITLGAPVWFIGGDHEPWATLDARGPGELTDGFTYLGRAGVRDVMGLKVAFLSGVFGDSTEGDMFDRLGRDERACWVRAEMLAVERAAARVKRIDVLLTHDWPDAVLGEDGDTELRRLSLKIGPAVHACGHRHRAAQGSLGSTKVVALADIASAGAWAGFVKTAAGVIEQVH